MTALVTVGPRTTTVGAIPLVGVIELDQSSEHGHTTHPVIDGPVRVILHGNTTRRAYVLAWAATRADALAIDDLGSRLAITDDDVTPPVDLDVYVTRCQVSPTPDRDGRWAVTIEGVRA